MDGARGGLNLFGQCVSSKWNAWRHSRCHNGTLYPDYEREPCNSMKRFVGMSGVGFVRIGSPNSIRHPFWLSILSSPSFSFRNDVSPAARFLSHWTLKYYAAFASVERAEIFAFYLLQARNGAASLIALLSIISFHTMDSLVCVLFISRGIFKKTSPRFVEDFRKYVIRARIWELFIAVINYIFYFRILNLMS